MARRKAAVKSDKPEQTPAVVRVALSVACVVDSVRNPPGRDPNLHPEGEPTPEQLAGERAAWDVLHGYLTAFRFYPADDVRQTHPTNEDRP